MPADGGGNELCMAAGVLGSVAGSPHAAHKLLNAHSSRLRSAQQRLLKPQNAGMQTLSQDLPFQQNRVQSAVLKPDRLSCSILLILQVCACECFTACRR